MRKTPADVSPPALHPGMGYERMALPELPLPPRREKIPAEVKLHTCSVASCNHGVRRDDSGWREGEGERERDRERERGRDRETERERRGKGGRFPRTPRENTGC